MRSPLARTRQASDGALSPAESLSERVRRFFDRLLDARIHARIVTDSLLLLIVTRQRRLGDGSLFAMAKARRDPLLRTLGWRVRQLRDEKGWTQEGLADRAGLDRSYVAGIESGLRNPSTKALAKLARALDVSIAALFEGGR